MMRWDIINRLIELYGAKSYLEIGVYNKELNYNKIKCAHKIGVDPEPRAGADFVMTSDNFFKRNKAKFDLIFIDGLHHKDQVIKDVENSLKALSDNGTIVVHDCNPSTEAMQQVPRIQGEWTGDVWKSWAYFRNRVDLSLTVIDTDYGVGIIRKGSQSVMNHPIDDYSDLVRNRQSILNLVPRETPGISVCIPAFEQYGHGVQTLTELLESLRNQTGEHEIIVSDNSDGNLIRQLCDKYPVVYYHNPNRGISQNTNFVISKAGYDHIKVMYQDDKLLQDNALELFSQALIFNGFVASEGRAMDGRSVLGRPIRPVWTGVKVFEKNTLGMPSVTAWRKSDILFDNNLKTLLDCDYYYQLSKLYGDPAIIRQPLVASRYWDGSTSRQQGNHSNAEMPYIKKKHNL